jgi:quinol monooxygenase YgiN
MFGTIGHARPKPGTEAQFQALDEEWWQTIRPKIPGPMLQLVGRPKNRPGEMVFVALAQDEATYRQLAAMPEQDAWYRKMAALIEGEPTWEDIEVDNVRQD